MTDRVDLIARKHEIRRQIETTRRQLEQAQTPSARPQPRKVAQLQTKLEQLMAEEYNLRLAIDQSAHANRF